MLKNYLFSGRILFTLIADFIIIFGVIYLNFDPVRMYAFYYLEFLVMLISYGIYNIITDKKLDPMSILIATIFMGFLIGLLVLTAINVIVPIDIKTFNQIVNLFYPYYDLPIFLMGIISANIINLRQYLTFEGNTAKAQFTILLTYTIFLIPGLLFAAIYSYKYNHNLEMNLGIALIMVRNFIEFMRYRGIVKLTSLSKAEEG